MEQIEDNNKQMESVYYKDRIRNIQNIKHLLIEVGEFKGKYCPIIMEAVLFLEEIERPYREGLQKK